MNAHARIRMSESDYLAWEELQDEKHELVDGAPKAMAGARVVHDRIVLNLLIALKTQLRGGPCEPRSADVKVRIPNGNYRYPDATVDCGKPANDALFAADPRVIVEVLSPATEFFDQADKLAEYQSIPGVAQIVLLSSSRAFARVLAREGDGWSRHDLADPADLIRLDSVGAAIRLGEAYEGVTFDPVDG